MRFKLTRGKQLVVFAQTHITRRGSAREPFPAPEREVLRCYPMLWYRMDSDEINGLPLPSLLIEMLHSGRWLHPGDEALKRLIPFLNEPIIFLKSVESMRRESPKHFAGDLAMARTFRFVDNPNEASDLPWLDVHRAVFIAVNRVPGDDVAIALDYRTDATIPRIVASDWGDGKTGCRWREVAPSFAAFVARLGAETL